MTGEAGMAGSQSLLQVKWPKIPKITVKGAFEKSYLWLIENTYCRFWLQQECPNETLVVAKDSFKLIESIQGWFQGPLLFIIELLLITLNYRDKRIKSDKLESVKSSVSDYFTKKIPVTSFLIVMMGVAFALSELQREPSSIITKDECLLPIQNEFESSKSGKKGAEIYNRDSLNIEPQIFCRHPGDSNSSFYWWVGSMIAGVSLTLFYHDKTFWKNAAKFLPKAALEEEHLGSRFFAIMMVCLLISSSFIEIWLVNGAYPFGFLVSWFSIDIHCKKEGNRLQMAGGINDITAGLLLIQSFLTLEKFLSVTHDPLRKTHFSQFVDSLILALTEIAFISLPWMYTFLLSAIFLCFTVQYDYNRTVIWKGSEFEEQPEPLNKILSSRFYSDPKNIKNSTISSDDLSVEVAGNDPKADNTSTGTHNNDFSNEYLGYLWRAIKSTYFSTATTLKAIFTADSNKEPLAADMVLDALPMFVMTSAVLFYALYWLSKYFLGQTSNFPDAISDITLTKVVFIFTCVLLFQWLFNTKSLPITYFKKFIEQKLKSRIKEKSRGSYSDANHIVRKILHKFYLQGLSNNGNAGTLAGQMAAVFLMVVFKFGMSCKDLDVPVMSESSGFVRDSNAKVTRKITELSRGVVRQMSSLVPKRSSLSGDAFLHDLKGVKLKEDDFSMMFFIDDLREGLVNTLSWVLFPFLYVLRLFAPSLSLFSPIAPSSSGRISYNNSSSDGSSNQMKHKDRRSSGTRGNKNEEPNKIDHRRLGEYYGYPRCCIEEYVTLISGNGGKYPEEDAKYKVCHQISQGSEFIPCFFHAMQKLGNTRILLDDLISSSRQARHRFPFDDDYKFDEEFNFNDVKKTSIIPLNSGTGTGTSTSTSTGQIKSSLINSLRTDSQESDPKAVSPHRAASTRRRSNRS